MSADDRRVAESPSRLASDAKPRGRPPRVAVNDIVDAALELFSTEGIHGASIATIAGRVGLTDAGLLHHFPSRDALVEAALARSVELQVEQMKEYAAPGGLAAIRALAAWGSVMEETPELMVFSTLVSADATRPDSLLREWAQRRYEALTALLAGLLREAIARGEIRADLDPEWEAASLIAFVDGIRLQWLLGGGANPIRPGEAVERHFAEVVERITANGPDRRPG